MFMVSMLMPLAYATAQEEPINEPTVEALVTDDSAKEGDKVTLCHNDNNWHEIEVSANAVDAHLSQGDFIVDEEHPCPPEESAGDITGQEEEIPAPPIPTVTIDAQKILCASEDMLPNWNDGADITETTAADFVASHDGCRLEKGWEFQWGPQAAPDAGPDFIGPAEGYTTFTGSTEVPLTGATIDQINVREVLEDGYIPFTNDNENTVSAEFWCGSDVLNYDNLEWISNPQAGTTYHCVAFNVPVKAPVENSCTLPDTESIDETKKTPADNDETSLQAFLTDAGYLLDVVADQTGIQRWTLAADKEVTVTTKFINSYAGNGNVFGYYLNGDLDTFTPIFRKGDVTGYESTPEAVEGDTFTTSIPVGAGTLGFAIRDFDGQPQQFTFATESALNIEGIDQALVYNPSENEYVLGFEDIDHAAYEAGDFNDLVASVSFGCDDISNEPQSCEIVSDTTNSVVTEGNPLAVAVTPHANWFNAASLGGAAKWIWSSLLVANPQVDDIQTFKKTFTSNGTVSASLQLAADNGYIVKVNGEEVANKFADEYNYENLTAPIDVADKLIDGTNTIEIMVKNKALEGSTPDSNPAGLLYKLSLEAESCSSDTPKEPENPGGPQCVDEREGSAADAVVIFTQGTTKAGNAVPAARSDANDALGTADWVSGSTENFFTLGFGGTITLSFDSFVPDVAGDDLFIHEATNGAYPLETAKVEVSQNGTDWVLLGTADNTTVDKVTALDLSGTGLSWIKFVKITDTSNTALFGDSGADGFDLDAVVVAAQVCAQPADPTDDDDDNDDGDDTNLPPVAVASATPASIALPTNSTTLSSAGSSDPDGDTLTYTWTWVSGPSTIDPADVANPTVSGLVAGTYVFKLTVSDGTLSDDETVTVTVVAPVQRSSSVVGGRGGSGGNGGGQVLGDFTGPAVLGDNACGEYITSYIKLGSKENDPENVKRLQTFLNEYMGANLIVDGVYGKSSYEALKKFQVKEIPEVLTPWIGITLKQPVGTGWVYKTTRRWINMIKCPELNIPKFERSQLTF